MFRAAADSAPTSTPLRVFVKLFGNITSGNRQVLLALRAGQVLATRPTSARGREIRRAARMPIPWQPLAKWHVVVPRRHVGAAATL